MCAIFVVLYKLYTNFKKQLRAYFSEIGRLSFLSFFFNIILALPLPSCMIYSLIFTNTKKKILLARKIYKMVESKIDYIYIPSHKLQQLRNPPCITILWAKTKPFQKDSIHFNATTVIKHDEVSHLFPQVYTNINIILVFFFF